MSEWLGEWPGGEMNGRVLGLQRFCTIEEVPGVSVLY